jgi:penicillin amidase
MGSSFPGAPGVVIGFNDSIAWGPTNAQRDLVDWYKVKFKDSKKAEYLSDGQWKPTQRKVEVIRVRGAKDFYDTIVFTHHGPVTYDDNFNEEKELHHFAYRWIAHDGGNVLRTFYELNRARNHAEYMAALDHYFFPAQNFAFAAVNGDIAMRVQGKYPVRKPGEGRFVLDGTQTSSEWKSFIPFHQNVMIKNPARGFVSSANQYPVDSTYPYFVHGARWEAYRNRSVNRALTAMQNITPAMMMALQNDNYNIQGEEYTPILLELMQGAPLSTDERVIIDTLARWNYVNSANSLAASYFEAWMEETHAAIWDEMDHESLSMERPSEYMTWWLLKHKPDLSFYDHQETPVKEDRKAIVQLGFKRMIERMEKWSKEKGKEPRWAFFKDSYIRHLARLEPFSVHAINGGNSSTLNASRGNWGPSWRMVVSLEKTGVKAWGIYPGGQSGNPGSPFYDNQIKAWEEARPFPLKFVQKSDQLNDKAFFSITLSPAQ